MFYKKFTNLAELIQRQCEIGAHNEWVYVNVAKWRHSPTNTELYYIPEDELYAQDERGEADENQFGILVPKALLNDDLENLIESQTLEGVIYNLQKNVANFTADQLAEAINYYLTYDTFWDN